jgi:hypothetical protein
MYTSAESRAQAEEKLAQAEHDNRLWWPWVNASYGSHSIGRSRAHTGFRNERQHCIP